MECAGSTRLIGAWHYRGFINRTITTIKTKASPTHREGGRWGSDALPGCSALKHPVPFGRGELRFWAKTLLSRSTNLFQLHL